MKQNELEAHVAAGMAGAQKLVGQISSLDDRTFIISVAAFLDEGLKSLIGKVLIDDREILDWASNSSGPISTFSSRIKMCRALGLLTRIEYRDLELLRKMRNNAAHQWDEFTLNSGPERGRAASFSKAKFMQPTENTVRKNLEARCKELLAWIQIMDTWANIPANDGTIAVRRLREIDFELKMIPVSG